MRKTTFCAVMLAAVLIVAASAVAQDLWIGDSAPALDVTKWIGGDPVDVATAKDKNILVLDFWATWCGPCVASMPHVTELQKKYAEKGVIVLGVTRPDDNNTLEMVEKFMEKNKNIMGYRSAFDAEAKTWDAYMKAAGRRGIPSIFIVDRTGTVAWIGHPNKMDHPLAEIVAGNYDIGRMKLVMSLEKRAAEMSRSESYDKAERAYRAIAALDPSDHEPWSRLAYMYAYRLQWPGKTREAALRAVELGHDDASFLRSFSHFLASRSKEYKCRSLALRAAERSVEIAPDDAATNIAFINALAANDQGDTAKARACTAMDLLANDAKGLSRLASALSWETIGYELLAIEAAKAAYELDPKSAPECLTLIRILANVDKTEEATAYGRKAMTTFVDDPQTLAWLASIFCRPELEGRGGEFALEAINAALTAEPEEATHLQTKLRVLALCQKDRRQAEAIGRVAVEKARENAGFLNDFAWSLLTEEGLEGHFNALALEAAQRCYEASGGDDYYSLDTLALAKFENGYEDEAVELQTKAVELAKEKGRSGASLADMEERLERFRKGGKKDSPQRVRREQVSR